MINEARGGGKPVSVFFAYVCQLLGRFSCWFILVISSFNKKDKIIDVFFVPTDCSQTEN